MGEGTLEEEVRESRTRNITERKGRMPRMNDTTVLDDGDPTDDAELLAISPVPPWPIQNGFTLRCAKLLEELAASWRITLVAPPGPDGSRAAPVSLETWIGVDSDAGPVAVPSAAEREPFRRAMEDLTDRDRYSAALLWAGTEYLAEDFEEFPPAVGDRIDSMTLMSWRNRVHRRSPRQRLSALRALVEAALYERSVTRTLAATIVVGEADADTLRRISGSGRVHVVPNGVDLEGLPDPDSKALVPTVLFTGVLSYEPNVQAIRWFVRRVWPHVRAELPEAVFEVAGRGPTKTVRRLAEHPGVRLRPNVPDMRAVQRSAWVAVAPMRSGAGIKNKVLEAWAAGTPVVMTRMATNGLQLEEGMSALVTDDPATMARTITRMLRDCRERERRGAEAYALAARNHSWGEAAARISGLLRTASREAAPLPRVRSARS